MTRLEQAKLIMKNIRKSKAEAMQNRQDAESRADLTADLIEKPGGDNEKVN